MTDAESFMITLAKANQLEAMRDLQLTLAGGLLAMPLTADVPSRARDLMGERCLAMMIEKGFGGRDIPILSGPAAGAFLRREMTAHYVAAGKSTAYIALKVGAPERDIIQFKRELREAGR